MSRRIISGLLFTLLIAFSVSAQGTRLFASYVWRAADLALIVPPGWEVASPARTDAGDLLLISDTTSNSTIRLLVLPDTTPVENLRGAFTAELAEHGLAANDYTQITWFGLTAEQSAVRGQDGISSGFARYGRMPDLRVLIASLRAEQSAREDAERAFDLLIGSLALDGDAQPAAPSLDFAWRFPADGEPTFTGLAGIDADAERVVTVDSQRGVIELNLADGTLSRETAFETPAAPTGIALLDDGQAYIGDGACRCLRVLSDSGTWNAPTGIFGGNAPFHLSDDGTTIYATDNQGGGYILQTIASGRSTEVPLSFNGAAAPYVIPHAGGALVVEWLASLIDGQTNGAISQVTEGAVTVETWLPISPDTVSTVTADEYGRLILGFYDGRVSAVQGESIIDLLTLESAPRALAFSDNGELVAAGSDGVIRAYRVVPEQRQGSIALQPDSPVFGRVSEESPSQVWTYTARAGEVATFNAIDPTQTNALDMAIRINAPDGRELAYNDDQRGADLYGVYDAHIPDLTFPADGVYTVTVDRVQGEGWYTLAVTPDRPFTLDAAQAATLTGRLMDAIPVERWAFDGRAGQVVTITMFGESGTLDPAIELLRPSGQTLAYNDDAYDPELGLNAQLFRVALPEDGRYVIEASRFEGTGQYTMIVVLNP